MFARRRGLILIIFVSLYALVVVKVWCSTKLEWMSEKERERERVRLKLSLIQLILSQLIILFAAIQPISLCSHSGLPFHSLPVRIRIRCLAWTQPWDAKLAVLRAIFAHPRRHHLRSHLSSTGRMIVADLASCRQTSKPTRHSEGSVSLEPIKVDFLLDCAKIFVVSPIWCNSTLSISQPYEAATFLAHWFAIVLVAKLCQFFL